MPAHFSRFYHDKVKVIDRLEQLSKRSHVAGESESITNVLNHNRHPSPCSDAKLVNTKATNAIGFYPFAMFERIDSGSIS